MFVARVFFLTTFSTSSWVFCWNTFYQNWNIRYVTISYLLWLVKCAHYLKDTRTSNQNQISSWHGSLIFFKVDCSYCRQADSTMLFDTSQIFVSGTAVGKGPTIKLTVIYLWQELSETDLSCRNSVLCYSEFWCWGGDSKVNVVRAYL